MMVDWVFIGLSTSPSSSSSSSILLEEWSCSSRWNAFSKSETTSLQGGGKTDIHASMLLLAFIHQYIHVSIHLDTHTFMCPYIQIPIHSYVHTFRYPYIHVHVHSCVHTCISHSLVHSLQEWDVSDGQDTLVQFHQLVQQLCEGANQSGAFTQFSFSIIHN